MLWLCAFLVTPLLSSGPHRVAPLVTVSSTHGAKGGDDDTWTREITLFPDGRFTAGTRSGRLSSDELATIRAELDALDFDTAPFRETCRARAIFHQRLATSRGHADESTPCGVRWSAAVSNVVAHLRDLTTPHAGPEAVLVRIDEAPLTFGAWKPRVIVFADGRFEGLTAKGFLGKSTLGSIRSAIAATRFALSREPVLCEAEPVVRIRVAAGSKEVAWASPCGSEPDASVDDLMRILGNLAGEE